MRYVAKLAGLYPDDPLEALFVDEVMATMKDVIDGLGRYQGTDKEKRREWRQHWIDVYFPIYLKGIETRIKQFHGGPCVLGEKVSIADLVVASFLNTCINEVTPFLTAECVKEYTGLLELRECVMRIPQVREWYELKGINKFTFWDKKK